jgi:lambda family phage portal protein
MNILDKTISFFNPKLGLERAKIRREEQIISSGKRAYDAATEGRRGDGWTSWSQSNNANHDIQKALKILRERSIHSYKNNSSAFSAHRKIQNNVIGSGIMPTPVSLIGEKKLTPKEIEIIKEEWKAFSESTECDWNGNMYMGGIQSLAMRTQSVQGEAFVLRQRDSKSRIPFKLQVLPPHMIDSQKNTYQIKQRDGNFVVQGVEFDSRGRKVGFWIFDSDPKSEYTLKIESKFVPADDVLQVFYQDFPEQVRGVPNGVPAMLNMRDLDDYEDAQLLLQKVSACHVGVTTRPEDPDNTKKYDDYDHIEPGMMQHLAPGEEITFNSPPTPGSYSEYVSKNQQKNASGFGITYEQLTGDMSNVNFSSGRMGWIEAQRQVEDWQYNMFIPQFCDKVWKWFIEGLIARGTINKKAGAEWTPQGREMIDPVKEMTGLILELKSGLISWTEACKRRGYNPEALLEQIKTDREAFKKLGIDVDWIVVPEADPANGAGVEGSLSPEDLKRVLDAYGVGVRAGTITPTDSDEKYFRSLAKFPEMSEAVINAWSEDDGFRRPITLAIAKDNSDFEA